MKILSSRSFSTPVSQGKRDIRQKGNSVTCENFSFVEKTH